jgi:hypothetical protein
MMKFFLIVFGIVGFIIVAGMTLVEKDRAQEQANPTCKSDWTKCKDNSDLANNYRDWTKVKVSCEMEAERQARYGTPKWPEPSWISFGSFLPGTDYVTSGTAVAIEKNAQFQNGFGAMVHSTVICTYDLRADRVTKVAISAR